MEEISIPWCPLVFSFIIWFLLKPLLDPRTYIKIGSTFTFSILSVIIWCSHSAPELVQLSGHILAWILIHTLTFWPGLPAAALHQNQTLVWTAGLKILALFSAISNSHVSWKSLLSIGLIFKWLWVRGGNYLSNRPKSVILSIVLCYLVSNRLFSSTELFENPQSLAIVWLTLLVYCNIERALAIAETWPKLCPGKGFFRNVLHTLIKIEDENLPQQDIADLKNVFNTLGSPKSFSELIIYLCFDLALPHGMRLVLGPIALFMRRLDDLVDNGDISDEVRLQQVQLTKQFFQEIFQGRDEDWEYGLWPREGGTTYLPVNLDKYVKRITYVEPLMLRSIIMISDCIPPKVVYDLLECFECEITDGVIKTEDDLWWFIKRAAESVGNVVINAGLTKWYLQPREVPKHLRSTLIEAVKCMAYTGQVLDIAIDITSDSSEGKVFIPLTWIKDPRHYDVLKKQRNPWALGNEILQSYSRELAQRTLAYTNLHEGYRKSEVVNSIIPLLKRIFFYSHDMARLLANDIIIREEFSPRFLVGSGSYLNTLVIALKVCYLPIKTPNGWLLI